MVKRLFKESLSPKHFIDWIVYKMKFRAEHPYWFDPCGTMIFTGAQGTGKTLSAVNYAYNIMKEYPNSILCTNIKMRDFPFNAYLDWDSEASEPYLADIETGECITSRDILAGRYEKVCVEYTGLDCLKYINNGEYGVTFLIDELHLELNSLESKNVDIEVMIEISQQRKQRKHIVGTSQVFMRLAKPLREQVADVIICRNFFGCLQFNKFIDGQTATEDHGKLQATVKGRFVYFHQVDMYERYDTYAKMKRYNKEWNGRARDPRELFERGVS